ncbi:hypothetical protein ACRWZ4_23925, partial [Escherichia coli]
CVCGKKIGPDPRNFNQRVNLGRNDLLIRTFPNTVLQFNYSNASYLGEFTISSSSDAGCISEDKAFRFAYFPLMLVSPARSKKQDTHTNLCGHAVMSF